MFLINVQSFVYGNGLTMTKLDLSMSFFREGGEKKRGRGRPCKRLHEGDTGPTPSKCPRVSASNKSISKERSR